MMTQTETETLIYETVDKMVEAFLAGFPSGLIEEAMRTHVTGPARIAGRVDAKLRELIPGVPTQVIPVLEGVIVDGNLVNEEER
jgi:hypothetical protein